MNGKPVNNNLNKNLIGKEVLYNDNTCIQLGFISGIDRYNKASFSVKIYDNLGFMEVFNESIKNSDTNIMKIGFKIASNKDKIFMGNNNTIMLCDLE